MAKTRGEALEEIALASASTGLSIGFFFAANYEAEVGLGSLLIASETAGFFVGLGAISAGLAMAFAPALVVGAIAVAFGSEKTVAEVGAATEKLSPLTSPATLALVPIGAFVTPRDPTQFANAVGPAIDLFLGAVSPSKFDNLQAPLQGLIGFSSWKSDVINFALHNGHFQAESSSGSPQNTGGPALSPASSGASDESGSWDSGGFPNDNGGWGSGGFPFDLSYPGDGDAYDAGDSSMSDSTSDNGGGMEIFINGIDVGPFDPADLTEESSGEDTSVDSSNDYMDQNTDSSNQEESNSSESTDNTDSPSNDDDVPDDDPDD